MHSELERRSSVPGFGSVVRLVLIVAVWAVGQARAQTDDLPPRVDLRPNYERWQLAPKHQGRRGTCSVFAAAAAYEYALARQGDRGLPVSEEFLNWASNDAVGRAHDGGFFHEIIQGFEKHGICRAESMPYQPDFDASLAPSAQARAEAASLRDRGFVVHWINPWKPQAGLTDAHLAAIKRTLQAGWPVCLGSSHSTLAVGYEDEPAQPGGGTFVIRDSALGDYRTLTYQHVLEKVGDVFWVEVALPATTRTLRSPDGRVRVEIRLPLAGSESSPEWSAWFGEEALFAPSRLRLVLEGGADLLRGASLEGVDERAHDVQVPILFGKASHASDRYREVRVALRSTAGMRVDVVVRCFDDAFAFRYEVPEQEGRSELRLTDEGTAFQIAGEPTAYVQVLAHHKTSHEHPITAVTASGIERGKLLDLPLTLAWPSGVTASITEAALRRYAGMSLVRDAMGALVSTLAPRQDGLTVVCALPMRSPWRVVLVGDRPGTLLESNAIHCLNDPPPVTDTAWIKPGKITWPWWNGYLFEAKPTEPILSQAMSVRYIDFCAAHGIAFHAVVADEQHTPWYHQTKVGLFPGPDTDATRVRADLDMVALRKYASEKGVGLWTWVHHGAVRGREEAVFAAFERLGWNGVMVDFLDSDDQETVEFAEAVLAAAARHHVLVHFHGMYKPTGLQRTFPNLMNHEGALNLEYLKWADTCTPEHTLRVAFTRLVAGPVDYHLGGFRAVRPADFKPTFTAPHVLGTRGHQLGLYVCFDNPAPMVADYPAAYRDQPGFDFVTAVPTWWDETRVLVGEIGRVLVTARRRGQTWFVGGISAGPARELAVPLTFLADEKWSMRVWRDVPDADPNQLEITTEVVGRGDTLRVRLAADGGFAARFEPSR